MISFSLDDKFNRIFIIYAFFTIGTLFFTSLFELYFSTLGLSISQIILSSIGIYLSPILLLPLLSKVGTRKSIFIGFVVYGIAAAVLFAVHSQASPFLTRAIIGLTIVFFWIPFNTKYYEFSRSNSAFLGSLYYSLSPILGLVFPALSGIIATGYGYMSVFGISALFFAISSIIAYKLGEDKTYKYDLWKSIESIKGLRTLFFIEGFGINSIVPVTLSSMILLYFKQPAEFGGVLSGATLFSIIASLITAKYSDKSGERRLFIIGSSLGFLLSAIFTVIAKDAVSFFIGFSLIGFFRGILMPLPLALSVDISKNLPQTIIARELFLNLGRVALVILGYFVIIYFDIRALLLIQTIVAAFYIPVFEMKKKAILKTS